VPALVLIWRRCSPLKNDHFTDSSPTAADFVAIDVHKPELSSHVENDDISFDSLVGKHGDDFASVASALPTFEDRNRLGTSLFDSPYT